MRKRKSQKEEITDENCETNMLQRACRRADEQWEEATKLPLSTKNEEDYIWSNGVDEKERLREEQLIDRIDRILQHDFCSQKTDRNDTVRPTNISI